MNVFNYFYELTSIKIKIIDTKNVLIVDKFGIFILNRTNLINLTHNSQVWK